MQGIFIYKRTCVFIHKKREKERYKDTEILIYKENFFLNVHARIDDRKKTHINFQTTFY